MDVLHKIKSGKIEWVSATWSHSHNIVGQVFVEQLYTQSCTIVYDSKCWVVKKQCSQKECGENENAMMDALEDKELEMKAIQNWTGLANTKHKHWEAPLYVKLRFQKVHMLIEYMTQRII